MGRPTFAEYDRRGMAVIRSLHKRALEGDRLKSPFFVGDDMRLRTILEDMDTSDSTVVDAWEELVWRVAIARRERLTRERRPSASPARAFASASAQQTMDLYEAWPDLSSLEGGGFYRPLNLRGRAAVAMDGSGRTFGGPSFRVRDSPGARERDPHSPSPRQAVSLLPGIDRQIERAAALENGAATTRAASSARDATGESSTSTRGWPPYYERGMLSRHLLDLSHDRERGSSPSPEELFIFEHEHDYAAPGSPEFPSLRGPRGSEPPTRLVPGSPFALRDTPRSPSPDAASRAWLQEYTSMTPGVPDAHPDLMEMMGMNVLVSGESNRRRRAEDDDGNGGRTLRRTRRRIDESGRDTRRDGVVFPSSTESWLGSVLGGAAAAAEAEREEREGAQDGSGSSSYHVQEYVLDPPSPSAFTRLRREERVRARPESMPSAGASGREREGGRTRPVSEHGEREQRAERTERPIARLPSRWSTSRLHEAA